MLRYSFIIAFLILYLTKSFGNPLPKLVDSLGIEKKNGKTFVLHRVEKGETLYSILKRYNSSEKEFYTANPDFNKTASITSNQVITIPVQVKSKSVPRPRIIEIQEAEPDTARRKGTLDENGIEVIDIPEATPKETPGIAKNSAGIKTEATAKVIDTKFKTHKVAAGEGLFGIASRYKVKVGQLREWNNLASDVLHVDQLLIVEKNTGIAATVREEKKEPVIPKITSAPATVNKPKPVSNPAVETEKNSQPETVVTRPLTDNAQTPVPNAPTGKKYSEQGIAEVINAGATTNKYLALHRTAPVGTLIKISNDANGQSVWVKVIGKLSGPGDVLIKISPMAFQKLQPRDKRIRASLSYVL